MGHQLTNGCVRMQTCRKIGNFNAAFALYCGISLSSITRLESVSTRSQFRFPMSNLDLSLLDLGKGSSQVAGEVRGDARTLQLQARLQEASRRDEEGLAQLCGGPIHRCRHCILYHNRSQLAGLYTKWLVAIEENNRTFLENNLVNLSKLRLIYRLIKEIQNYQSRGPAPYLPSPDLKRTLLSIKPLNEVP